MGPVRQLVRRAADRLAVPRLAHPHVRVYETVRTAHLERAATFRPASILYAGERYDFDTALAAGVDLHRVGPARLVATLLTNPVEGLEVNEPLQRSGLVQAVLAVTAVRIGARLSGGRRRQMVPRPRIGSYAIENRDPFSDRPPRLRSRLRRGAELGLSRVLTRRLDRIVFGTEGARDLYRRRLGPQLSATATRLVPALPTPCSCPPSDLPTSGPQVIYLGALHVRKGVRQLLASWPLVAASVPGARLVVVGKGELEDEVRAVAEARTDVDLVIDPPRPEIHRQLRRADTLVLVSQRSPRWREQVGLPIVEGLGHGCRVVASSETGLAGWLSAHGHQVVDPDAGEQALAEAIRRSLLSGSSRADVLDTLPAEDGRRGADDWLLHGVEPRVRRPAAEVVR